MSQSRPSLLSRATNALAQNLEIHDADSYAHRTAPPSPSNWNDTHRRYLLRVWDSVAELTASSAKHSSKSIPAQLAATQQTVLKTFPELADGKVALTREWIEYVLGIALRHPFCTAEKMGRWELLASSGGARGIWGPW
jgi:hypothetical protein